MVALLDLFDLKNKWSRTAVSDIQIDRAVYDPDEAYRNWEIYLRLGNGGYVAVSVYARDGKTGYDLATDGCGREYDRDWHVKVAKEQIDRIEDSSLDTLLDFESGDEIYETSTGRRGRWLEFRRDARGVLRGLVYFEYGGHTLCDLAYLTRPPEDNGQGLLFDLDRGDPNEPPDPDDYPAIVRFRSLFPGTSVEYHYEMQTYATFHAQHRRGLAPPTGIIVVVNETTARVNWTNPGDSGRVGKIRFGIANEPFEKLKRYYG